MAETFRQRISGKWQIPFFLVSVGLLTAALLNLRKPPPLPRPVTEHLVRLEELVSKGLHQRAIGFGKSLLKREDVTEDQVAFIHLEMARSRFAEALRRDKQNADSAAPIVEHYLLAETVPGNLTAEDLESLAQCLEWQSQFGEAVRRYDEAADRGGDRSAELRRTAVELRRSRLSAPAKEIDRHLDAFLAETPDDDHVALLWGLEQKLNQLETLGRLHEGKELLAKFHHAFENSGSSLRFAYLEGWLYYKQGQFDEAENQLRSLISKCKDDDATYAQAGWLLGRTVMSDGGPQRPEEALSVFSDAISHQPVGPYAAAIRLGQAESLAMLERHEDAIELFRRVTQDVDSLPTGGPADREALRAAVGVQAETLRQAGSLVPSLEYARMAVELVDRTDSEQAAPFLRQLAQVQVLLGEKLEAEATAATARADSDAPLIAAESRAQFGDAAETYLELSKLLTLNERRSAEASWLAAEQFARAGRHERAAELYEAYAKERPSDSLVPRALLRVGQSLQKLGRPSAAIAALQECYSRFPRSLDGMNSLVPLAECYLALGPEYEDEAGDTLRIILDDSDVFTPEAPVFADALFLLGEVHNRRGELDRSIEVLEEAIARYPQDGRAWRSLYFLADSYRRSAMGLKQSLAEAKSGARADEIRDRAMARFRKAQEHYHRLNAEHEKKGSPELSRVDAMYSRHAFFCEADCAFETHDYRKALSLYEEAAGRYQHHAHGLAAYVQIINCHAFLGETAEARSALARALVLVKTLPNEAFESFAAGSMREEWRNYFEWLDRPDVF